MAEIDNKKEAGLLARVSQFFVDLGMGTDGANEVTRSRLSKTDFGVLKVAFMVAALDGVLLSEEYATFDRLARKCRGWTPERGEAVLNEALRAAGYLLIQKGRLPEEDLLALFAEEAEKALPVGFAYGSPRDVRRAFVMWTAMAMADGSYSDVERKGIALLQRNFGVLQRERFAAEIDLWGTLASAYRTSACVNGAGHEAAATLKLLPDGFLDRAEAILAHLVMAANGADEQALADLIVNGR